ncbi:hypothetical protein BDR26DRAFT_932774 [Obelidium mucronatum]|nr:hypothetical protein BDR26DRAFT_932774 [Obelidium mucronatum]
MFSGGSQDMPSDYQPKFSCDRLRRRINEFLAQKTMTQTEFLRQTQTNSNSFRRFMSYKGAHKGNGIGLYVTGSWFFDCLDRKIKAEKANAGGGSKSKTAKSEAESLFAKIAAAQLPADQAIYDDCDVVRQKIFEFLAIDGVTKTALLRAMGNVNGNSLAPFLSAKGPTAGCNNLTYRAAYTFFERKRIAFDEPKTAKRIKAEQEHAGGFSTEKERKFGWVMNV